LVRQVVDVGQAEAGGVQRSAETMPGRLEVDVIEAE
jgi:hypothetical protein